MDIFMKRVLNVVPAWLYLARARGVVSILTAELPGMRLSPGTQEEFALEVAALMGELEQLLSVLRRSANRGVLAAVDEGVPASVIAASLYERSESREFGGHAEKKA